MRLIVVLAVAWGFCIRQLNCHRTGMKQIDVAIAVVVVDNRVLVCQRKDKDTFGGYWEFPGGKRDGNESIEQCLRRELREELDIEVEPVSACPVVRHSYPHVHLALHPFLCRLMSGQPKLIECQKLAWVLPGELGEYKFPPANATMIRDIVERLKSVQGVKV